MEIKKAQERTESILSFVMTTKKCLDHCQSVLVIFHLFLPCSLFNILGKWHTNKRRMQPYLSNLKFAVSAAWDEEPGEPQLKIPVCSPGLSLKYGSSLACQALMNSLPAYVSHSAIHQLNYRHPARNSSTVVNMGQNMNILIIQSQSVSTD